MGGSQETVVLVCVVAAAVVVTAILFLVFRRRYRFASAAAEDAGRPMGAETRKGGVDRHLAAEMGTLGIESRGDDEPATDCSLATARGSPLAGASPRPGTLYQSDKSIPSVEWWGGMDSPIAAAGRRGVDGIDATTASTVGDLPCRDEVFHDFGVGWKKCGICGARPIYNRGCSRCDMRMCERCFAWHRIVRPDVRPADTGGKIDIMSPVSPSVIHPSLWSTRETSSSSQAFSAAAAAADEFPMPDDIALGPGVCVRPKKGAWGMYRLCPDFQWLRPAPGKQMSEEMARYLAGNVEALRQGLSLTYFTFLRGDCSKQADLDVSARILALSTFEDECSPPPQGINLPRIDVTDAKQRATWTFVVNKSQYCIGPSPRWSFEDIDEKLIASHYYAKCCMPPGTAVMVVKDERAAGLSWFPNQFRIKKPVVPYLYGIQIMMKVTPLSEQQCRDLAPMMCDGLRIDKGFLLERTKRNVMKTDAIAKVKSLLLYHRLKGGGMIVTMPTAAVAWSLPQWLRSVLNSLTHLNCKDVTATTEAARIFYSTKCYSNCGIDPPEGYVPNTQQTM